MSARVDAAARARALDELYGTSPEQFTERRDALAKALKDEGDAEGAAELRTRRRPTKVAFLLNQLARQAPDDVAALVDLGRELARTQRRAIRGQAGADELRAAIVRQREAVAKLVRRAAEVGRTIGVDASPLLDEVASTLRTAMTDPAAGAELEEGRLAKAPEVAIGLPSDGPEEAVAPAPHVARRGGGHERERERAKQEQERERERVRAEHERERVERERAAAHARELATRAAELRAAAREADTEARRARAAAEAAEREAEKRLRAADDAERRAAEAAREAGPSRPVVPKRPAHRGPGRAAHAHRSAEAASHRARPSRRSSASRARHG